MKWLVFGAKGWIGSYVCDLLKQAKQTVVEQTTHLASARDFKDLIRTVAPARIVCAVGRTYGPGFSTIDYLEQPGKLTENLESNLLIPVWIAQAAPEIPILYFGTGCIYEYDGLHDEKGFKETDEPNFTGSSYSTVKRITDKIMGAFPHVINARIRMPISDDYHPRDFITKLLNYNKITSIPNSMTVLSEIIPALLVATHEGRFFGTVNAVNTGTMDHNEILQAHEIFSGRHHEYLLEPVEEQNKRLLSRRSNNHLNNGLLQNWVSQFDTNVCQLYGLSRPIPSLRDSIPSLIRYRVRGNLNKSTNPN